MRMNVTQTDGPEITGAILRRSLVAPGSLLWVIPLVFALASLGGPTTAMARSSKTSKASKASKARKADVRRADARAIESRAFFRQGLYKEAARGFMEAYAIVKRAPLVYAAARAWEKGGDLRRAHAMFSLYLDQPNIPDENKVFARRKVRKLAGQLQRARQTDAAPKVRARAQQSVGLPVWSTAAGGTLLIGGGAFWLLARSIAADLGEEQLGATVKNSADATTHRESAASARMWQKVAIGSAVVGTGLLGYSAWQASGRSAAPTGASLQLLPTLTGEGPGWALNVRF
jgi:hypothetical protein